MSEDAPTIVIVVIDVGMPKLPVTARDHFGKCIEQEDKGVAERKFEFKLTEVVQDVHDRAGNFKDDHVVARVSLTDEQDPFGNNVVPEDERSEGEKLLEVIGLVTELPGRHEQRRKDLPKLGKELPKLAEDRFDDFHEAPPKRNATLSQKASKALFMVLKACLN